MSEDRREHTTHYVDLVNRVRAVVKGKSMFTVDGKPSSGYTRFVMLAECADAILRLRAELAAARAEVEAMRRVVGAAVAWRTGDDETLAHYDHNRLQDAVDAYLATRKGEV